MISILKICLILMFTVLSCAQLRSQELRTGIDFDRNIHPKVEFLSEFQIRKSFYGGGALYTITQAGFEYKITKHISIASTFRYSLGYTGISESSLQDFHDKMRYTVETKVKSQRFDNGVRLKYRLRYQESRTLQGNSKNYLRNKMMAEYKFIKEMSPFVGAELYYQMDENEFRKFRLYLGADIKPFKREAEVCYIMEGIIDDSYFLSYHIIGLFFQL